MTSLLKYVIVTPARNEGDHIGLTLASVVKQTILPIKWVIVSDGSTDNTDEIVQKYAAEYQWIELVRMPERRERHFAGKVMAFNAGWDRVKSCEHDVICSLDADVSFEPEYFEYLLARLAENPKLGLVGTPFTEGQGTYDFRFSSVEHVSGACQVFRRECFNAIGGYTPIKGGGIDLVAVVSARMRGWETRTFTDKLCFHHKKMNSAMNKGLRLPFRWGQSDYRLGSHPAWQFFRCVYQMSNQPYIVGGLVCMSGYFYSLMTRQPRAVSSEFAKFRGREQMLRLKKFFVHRKKEDAKDMPVLSAGAGLEGRKASTDQR